MLFNPRYSTQGHTSPSSPLGTNKIGAPAGLLDSLIHPFRKLSSRYSRRTFNSFSETVNRVHMVGLPSSRWHVLGDPSAVAYPPLLQRKHLGTPRTREAIEV